MLKLTVDHPGITDKGLPLTVGSTVEYLGHLPGGCVGIEINGQQHIAHPHCFKELR